MEFQASQFRKSFKGYKIFGKAITKKVLTAHVNKALEVFADMQENPEGSEESSENGDDHESTDGKTDEEGEAVEGAE